MATGEVPSCDDAPKGAASSFFQKNGLTIFLESLATGKTARLRCEAEKAAAMFKATSDLGDWAVGGDGGGAVATQEAVSSEPPYQNALPTEEEVEEPVAGDSAETIRFKVTVES